MGLVNGHTMTIMLIASVMRYGRKTADEILVAFQNSDFKFHTKVAVDKEGINADEREQVVYDHTKILFDMTEIMGNEHYSCMIKYMTEIPPTGIDVKTFFNLVYSGDDDYTDINFLIERRWLQHDKDNDIISLHPIISQVAKSELGFVKIYKDIKEEARKGILRNNMGFFSELVKNNKERALERLTKALKISKGVRGERDILTGMNYFSLGDVYKYMGDNENALLNYNSAIEVFKENQHQNSFIINRQRKLLQAEKKKAVVEINIMIEEAKELFMSRKPKEAADIIKNAYGKLKQNNMYKTKQMADLNLLLVSCTGTPKTPLLVLEALNISKSVKDDFNIGYSYWLLTDIYENMGKHKKAVSYCEKTLKYFNKALVPNAALLVEIKERMCKLKSKP